MRVRCCARRLLASVVVFQTSNAVDVAPYNDVMEIIAKLRFACFVCLFACLFACLFCLFNTKYVLEGEIFYAKTCKNIFFCAKILKNARKDDERKRVRRYLARIDLGNCVSVCRLCISTYYYHHLCSPDLADHSPVKSINELTFWNV